MRRTAAGVRTTSRAGGAQCNRRHKSHAVRRRDKERRLGCLRGRPFDRIRTKIDFFYSVGCLGVYLAPNGSRVSVASCASGIRTIAQISITPAASSTPWNTARP